MPEGRSQTYLQLVRFPLIFTVWSDALTGYLIAAAPVAAALHSGRVAMMLAVTAFLGAGGMTLCDCFEYESAKEHGRPRTLPIGVTSVRAAYAAAFIMILLSVAGATLVSSSAGLMMVLLALFLLVFASVTRAMPFLGAANLSLGRGVNILVGMAFAQGAGPLVPKGPTWVPVAAVVCFVFIVTQVASQEEHPRRGRLLRLTGALILLLVAFHVLLYASPLSKASLVLRIIVSVSVTGTVLRLLQLGRRSVHELSTASVEKLVVAGLVATIVLDANFVAFTGEIGPTIGVLFLLLPTFVMFRFFHMLYPGTETAID